MELVPWSGNSVRDGWDIREGICTKVPMRVSESVFSPCVKVVAAAGEWSPLRVIKMGVCFDLY